MRETVFEDKLDGGKITRYYAGTRLLCDRCKKVIANQSGKALIPYFNVSTHYRSNGMEVLDSYKRYDYCSESCLQEAIERYIGEVGEYTNEREIHIHYTGEIR